MQARFKTRLLATAAMIVLSAGAARADFALTILHTNDFHARFEPISKYDSTCDAETNAAGECFGGTGRLVSAVTEARARAGTSILVDGGDQFQGTLFYTYYKGKVAAEMMNKLGYDGMTVGNHEFDDGPEGLAKLLDGAEFNATPAEKRDFEAAMAELRKTEFPRAAQLYQQFLVRYPDSGYTPAVQYWLGNTHYALREYKEAIAVYQRLMAVAPSHPRVPESMQAIANCQIELKDVRAAKRSLEDLVKAHPQSEAAATARDRLARLRCNPIGCLSIRPDHPHLGLGRGP